MFRKSEAQRIPLSGWQNYLSAVLRLTQISTRALLRLQPDIIVTKLSQTTTSGKGLLYEVLDPDHSSALRMDATGNGTITTPTATKMRSDQAWNISNLFGTFRYSRRCYSIVKRKRSGYQDRRREVEEIRAKYYAPSWLVNRAWEMRAVKSSLGWTFCPRTYNVVPSDSPIFISIRRNDVKGLQELFIKMEASPFDCSESDMTPLVVSIIFQISKKNIDTEHPSWLLYITVMTCVNS